MFLSLIAISAIAQQQVKPVRETVIPLDMLSASIDGHQNIAIGEPIIFKVLVRDIDVKAFYNPQTEAVRSQIVYSDEQTITADPELHGGSKADSVSLVRQDQMTIDRVGWDEKHEWFEYQISVKLYKEQQVAGKYFTLAIGIHDTSATDWLRDKPTFLASGFALK